MIFRKSKAKPTVFEFLAKHFNENEDWREQGDDLELLVELIRFIRPKNPNIGTVDLTEIIRFLKQNQTCRTGLSDYVKGILHQKKFSKILSDAAILQDVDFFFELRKRIYAKILPYQSPKDTLEFVLNQVFYLAKDIYWIERIPREQLHDLYEVMDFDSIYEDIEQPCAFSEVLLAMNLIIQRISGRAMEPDVIKMVPEFDGLESPFTAFEKELLDLEERITESPTHYIGKEDISYRQLLVFHHQCEEFVQKAFSNSSKYGISLRVNQNLLRIRQQLHRIQLLIQFLVVENEGDKKENGVTLALALIKYNCYKNNVRKFIAESTQLISYEITQHTAKTGENYITVGRSEYFKMFRTAMGGGFIVGILCILKLLLSYADTSYFGHAFLYSMNYAIGFIAIYILGFTLATKQPAMTASALVRALEEGTKKQGNNTEKYGAFAILFARVFRSQFIAFVGNVLMAFPVALLGIWLIDYAFDYNIAAQRWPKLINDISPIHSAAVFHAAIAGVFLFLSGIISGSIANRDKHGQVYYRIQEHPLLKKSFGKKWTHKLAAVYEKRWAGIASNFWFGVFLGSTASIGLFLGLNLDIRHITFASGNLALALYGSNHLLGNTMLFWGIFGIGIIGLVNFLVSFGLSLGLAFRSRDISIFELRFVTSAILKHFWKKPLSFFLPTERREKTVVQEKYLSSEEKK